MRKQTLSYEILTKENRYDAAYVVENGNMIEVAFDLNSDTLEPREITYRLVMNINDPLARWIGQGNVEYYVSKDGIDAAIRKIAKMIRKQKGFINKAKKHPAYKEMKEYANMWITHFKADFYTHDLLAIGKDFSKKFIWMVRNTGTHILFNQSEWNDAIIENELKLEESLGIFFYNGERLDVISRYTLKLFYQEKLS